MTKTVLTYFLLFFGAYAIAQSTDPSKIRPLKLHEANREEANVHMKNTSGRELSPHEMAELRRTQKGKTYDYDKIYQEYVDVDGMTLDKRIFYYYEVEQIKKMSKEKKAELNLFFQKSYVLHSECPASDFDVNEYTFQRKEHERVTITLLNGCGTVELLSQDELKQLIPGKN